MRVMRQRGFGLLEIILVVALTIVAGAVIFAVFESARPSSQANTEIQKLSTLTTNLKAAYGINHDYSGLTNALAIRNRQVPEAMVASDGTVQSLWGAVEITPAAVRGNANRGFQIVYRNIPPEVCLKVVLGAAPLFPEGVAIGTGTSVALLRADHTVDMTRATPACAPADGASVDVVFLGQ